MIGGIRVNSWGETNISGLFAAGEVACTGAHGANRLASNSLLEVLVFGKRIIERAGGMDKPPPRISSQDTDIYHLLMPARSAQKDIPVVSLSALQRLLWDRAGIIRNREGLTEAADTLAAWQQSLPLPGDRKSYELANMVLTGRLMVEAALLREESRGAHFRSDFPQSSSRWLRHIVITKGQDSCINQS
jgi:L-aspartate oxidase